MGTDEWSRGKARLDAVREFSKNIGHANKERLAHLKKVSEVPKEMSARDKALDFARRVHRPKIKSSSASSTGRQVEEDEQVAPRMHELEKLDTHQ